MSYWIGFTARQWPVLVPALAFSINIAGIYPLVVIYTVIIMHSHLPFCWGLNKSFESRSYEKILFELAQLNLFNTTNSCTNKTECLWWFYLAFQYVFKSLQLICAYYNLCGYLAFSELHFPTGSQFYSKRKTANSYYWAKFFNIYITQQLLVSLMLHQLQHPRISPVFPTQCSSCPLQWQHLSDLAFHMLPSVKLQQLCSQDRLTLQHSLLSAPLQGSSLPLQSSLLLILPSQLH